MGYPPLSEPFCLGSRLIRENRFRCGSVFALTVVVRWWIWHPCYLAKHHIRYHYIWRHFTDFRWIFCRSRPTVSLVWARVEHCLAGSTLLLLIKMQLRLLHRLKDTRSERLAISLCRLHSRRLGSFFSLWLLLLFSVSSTILKCLNYLLKAGVEVLSRTLII